jgi:hypothetical protein
VCLRGLPGQAHAFGEVEPQLGMRDPVDFLLAEIAQHGAPQSPVGQPRVQRAQIGRERRDVMVVLRGVFLKVVAGEFIRRPSLLE